MPGIEEKKTIEITLSTYLLMASFDASLAKEQSFKMFWCCEGGDKTQAFF